MPPPIDRDGAWKLSLPPGWPPKPPSIGARSGEPNGAVGLPSAPQPGAEVTGVTSLDWPFVAPLRASDTTVFALPQPLVVERTLPNPLVGCSVTLAE